MCLKDLVCPIHYPAKCSMSNRHPKCTLSQEIRVNDLQVLGSIP